MPGSGTENRYVKSPPGPMFAVAGSVPSISLRSAMPCQCTDVGSPRRLVTETTISSPTVARISGPGMVLP
ncbi:Uncharacterised protein [Mycobacterium tuberculosis]|uniref:Uncharacterized protein n=2 Tax=Mycobacterium tuberculosis TaxID=1773 RepID=A0A916LE44_MYCTX|nr:Uncharacterised protein [Mycobacterium tuberculosis]COZ18156.1 Uncharacterised protein [Mycobacterium tuberculosis]COZ52084.1 Uncharacterised protein [Mycobacterium tuberculosis]